ncbi:MAG: hypothetical protein ACI9LV_000059 [Candidatus Nanohaloarchaea archaeon]|jgi:hypothetical protein
MSLTMQSTVFKIFLPILVGLAIFGTLDSIKVNSLDPNVNSFQDALGSIDRSVTFGDIYEGDSEENPDEDKAKQEVRETILVNMIMAQRCDFLPLVDDADWRQLGSGNPDKDVVYFNYDTGNVGEAFEVSKGKGEAPLTCVGTDSPTEIVKPALDGARPGPNSKQTNDMEGRFGKIGFNMENTLVFEEPQIGSLSLYKDAPTDFGNFPDFWRNSRTSLMLPDGLSSNDCSRSHAAKKQAVFYPEHEPISALYEIYSGNNEDINKYNGGQRMIYAFRVRMQNIPIIKEGYDGYTNGLTLCGRGTNSDLKEFLLGADGPELKPAKYVLCENATGYIQSNAGAIDNSGETDVDNFDWASGFGTEIVFPRMVAERGATDCIDQSPDLTVEGNQVGPELDFGNGGESCSFQEVMNYHKEDLSGRNWNGIDVKCGLVEDQISQKGGGGFNYYNTVWYGDKDQSCEESDSMYDITDIYKVESSQSSEVARDSEGLHFNVYESGGSTTASFLDHYRSVEKVVIHPLRTTEADVTYQIETSEGNSYTASSTYDDDTYRFYIEGENLGNEEESGWIYYLEEEEIVFESNSDGDNGRISFASSGDRSFDIGQINSFKVKVEGKTGDSELKGSSVEKVEVKC